MPTRVQPPPTPEMLDNFDRPAADPRTVPKCDPWAVAGPRCDALNSHGNDLLDPMIIIGRYKLLMPDKDPKTITQIHTQSPAQLDFQRCC